jgi:aspartate aminotransferase
MKLAARLHGQAVTSAATFTMHAAVAALTGPQDAVLAMRDAYQRRRDFMVDALNEMPGVSCPSIEGAFYLFPHFTHTEKDSIALAETLLDKAGLAVTPGSAFGRNVEGCLRFSIATAMTDLERAVERLARVVTEL